MTSKSGADLKVFPTSPRYQPLTAHSVRHNPDFIAAMAGANDAAPRYEIYAAVHKGLRACMVETLTNLGRVDAASESSVAQALGMVNDLLEHCSDHLAHENEFIHAALERVQPGSAARCAADHVQHVADIAKLRARVDAVNLTAGPGRERALVVLYRLLALFVAENFEHMSVEESAHTETLWAHYSDDELRAIEHEIVSHIKPDRLMAFLRWMLPFASRQERARMLKGMKAGMPPEAFAGLLDMVKPHLRFEDRAAIALDLAEG